MIFVDPRVGSKHLAEGFAAQNLPFELTFLEYGDCAFFGNGPNDTRVSVGVELKNVSDLINSMRSGRLAGHQLPGLLDRYGENIWLIVEGGFRCRQKDGLLEVARGKGWAPLRAGSRLVFWKELESFLTTLEVQAGIHIRYSRDETETARLIGLLYRWWTDKEFDDHRSLKVLDVPIRGLALVQQNAEMLRVRKVAACLPKIGWGRSKAVAERFRSVIAMVQADLSEWEAIEGIGKGIAGDVYRAIREEVTAPTVSAEGVSQRGVTHPRSTRGSRVREDQ